MAEDQPMERFDCPQIQQMKKKKAKKTSNAEEAKDLCKDRMAVK